MSTALKLSQEKLAKLSKEQKLKLFDIIEERKRRARERRALYVPNDGQAPVHRSPAKLRAVFTGNGGGKTALGVHEAKWAVEGFNPETQTFTPVPARVYVVLDKPEKVESVWLPELKKWTNITPEQLHKRGKPYYNHISFPNGSFISFLFHDQEPMTFESIEGDVFIFDEPPPRHVYIGLRRAGRTKGRKARYLIIGTPLAAAWMRKEIYEPWARGELKDTECFKYGTEVNRANLAEGYIEEFAAVLSEKEQAIRLRGEFFDLDGLALAHLFDRTKHLVAPFKWSMEWPVVVAIDPHPQKNHVAVMVGAHPDGLFYLKELSAKCLARDFARRLKEFYRGHRVVDIVCDSLGNAEMTGGEGFKSFIQVLKEEGVRVRATSYQDKNDAEWMDRIQNALALPLESDNFGRKTPELRFFNSCRGIIADIETVQWAKMRNLDEYKPTLDIGSKDYLACLKYALACNVMLSRRKTHAVRRHRKVTTYGQRAASPQLANRHMLKSRLKQPVPRSGSAQDFDRFDDDDDF